MKDLASTIHRDKSTITALVNKLIKLGYIKKEQDEKDVRVTLISLTQKGREFKKDFDEISKEVIKKLYLGFDSKEKSLKLLYLFWYFFLCF